MRLSRDASIDLRSVVLAGKFRDLVARASDAGLAVIADSDGCAIRLVPAARAAAGEDLRGLGDVVRVHGGCGGGGSSCDEMPHNLAAASTRRGRR